MKAHVTEPGLNTCDSAEGCLALAQKHNAHGEYFWRSLGSMSRNEDL